jgi:hypothetical protein
MHMQDSRSAHGEDLHIRAGCGQSIHSLLQHGPITLMTSRWLLVPHIEKRQRKGLCSRAYNHWGDPSDHAAPSGGQLCR